MLRDTLRDPDTREHVATRAEPRLGILPGDLIITAYKDPFDRKPDDLVLASNHLGAQILRMKNARGMEYRGNICGFFRRI